MRGAGLLLFAWGALHFCRPLEAAPIQFPIEVMGVPSDTETVTVTLAAGQAATVTGLWMQVNNLSYPNPTVSFAKGSVQINAAPPIQLTNTTAQVASPASQYGGIGGVFNTIKLTLPLPAGLLHDGANTIGFIFNQTDGVSGGYRILNFNLMAGSSPILPSSDFTQEDPSLWTAPAGGNAASGQNLWNFGAIVASPINSAPLSVSCRDCHAKDGRDLKYFNFSNKSIEMRSKFHGLSAQAGLDIAAFIRGLAVTPPSKARPWNPPYQPGPGLDAAPISDWAAGAGVNMALDKDSGTLSALFPPSGTPSAAAIAASADANVREIPVQLQFLDWNHWLPRTSPADSFGAAWVTGAPFNDYGNAALALTSSPPTSATINDIKETYFDPWAADTLSFVAGVNGGPWNPATSQKIYDILLWKMVKEWELVNQFNLQGFGQTIYGASVGEPRGWFSGTPFQAAPNELKIPNTSGQGIDGSDLKTTALSAIWYQIQLTLFGHRANPGSTPFDWGQTWKVLNQTSAISGVPSGARFAYFLAKAGQMSYNGKAPDDGSGGGPRPFYASDISQLAHASAAHEWDENIQNRAPVLGASLGAWFNATKSFTAQQYEQAGQINAADAPTGYEDWPASTQKALDDLWVLVPRFHQWGVDSALLGQVVAWAQGIWKSAPWTELLAAGDVPSVSLQPSSNQTLAAPITLTAQPVNCPSGFQVQFFSDGVLIGKGAAGSNGQYQFIWSDASTGAHKLDARVVYPDGYLHVAFPPTVTVTGGASLPPITLTWDVQEPLSATLSFSYPVPSVHFLWTITPSMPSSQSAGSSLRLFSQGAPISTPSPSLGLATQNLPSGSYTVGVQATDGTAFSPVAYRGLTLVYNDLNNARVHPNPWRSDRGYAPQIIFDRLAADSTIKIFTISGHLVKSIAAQSDSTAWDLTNDSGDKAASGIYLYLIESAGGKAKGKLGIIR